MSAAIRGMVENTRRGAAAVALVPVVALVFALGCEGGKAKDSSESPDTSANDSDSGPPDEATTLKEKYADYFSIGAAVNARSYRSHADLLKEHFNSVTAENEMKFESLQGTEGRFTYAAADAIAGFAVANHMTIRGHALVWHHQTPDWVFEDAETGEDVSKEKLFERMKEHISNVVGHFKGQVGAWDVVNEAIMNDGRYRTGDEDRDDQKSRWYAIAGESYIAEAFKYAHEADPDAKLFYNDYFNYLPVKRDAIYNMLEGLLDDGVPVHGVGLQCHLKIEPASDENDQAYYQTADELEKAIELYASLGLEVHVTEMDVSLYLSGVQYTEDTYYTEETFTEELEDKQAERYAEFFDMYREHKDTVTNVTVWGVADDDTWLSRFDSGRQDFPLLFDTNHEPKKAFDAVFDF